MREPLRHRLTYANVMSTLAVFIALGGSSYATVSISGSNIKNRSISASKVKKNALTGLQIRESTLGRVNRARLADNSLRPLKLRVVAVMQTSPADTYPTSDVCVERVPRAASSYGGAVLTCLDIGRPAGPGRRLPTHGELRASLTAFDLAPGGELTSHVYPSASVPGGVDVLYVTNAVGNVALTPDSIAGGKSYRCVTDPLN